MSRTKALISAVAFAAALATPAWTAPLALPGGDTGAGSTAAGSSQSEVSGHDDQAAGGHGEAGAAGAAESGSSTDWKTMDEHMAKRDRSFPVKTKGKGNQLLTPKVLADGTKEFHLTAKVAKWELEPGKVVDAWTYNGMVPGPIMRVNVGDKVRIVVQNKLPASTVVHWHGLPVPNAMDGVADVTQDPIKPNESFTYSFTASRESVGWYHSHHNGTKQVGDGMFGTFLIGDVPVPKDVKVAQEIPMVLQDGGAIGLSLNGKSFPATEPIRARKGEWVKLHYFNAGSQAHPMHLHGLDQVVIAKDGFPLAQSYKADTVPVAPGERYTVLIKADQPGTWAFHCHVFPHSEGAQGMFGMFTEMIVT